MKLAAAILAIIAIVIGISIVGGGDDSNTGSNAQVSNHVIGESELKVRFVEAGDFECPACSDFHPLLKQVKDEYKDRVEFQYSHFPIIEIHPNALSAHRAAIAAGNQGKFWEMHDLLYEQRFLWISSTTSDPIDQLENFAQELELDMDQYRADFASSATSDTINADLKDLRDRGVNSTPTFFLNDEKLSNASVGTIEALRALLDEALANAADGAGTDSAEDAQEAEPAADAETL